MKLSEARTYLSTLPSYRGVGVIYFTLYPGKQPVHWTEAIKIKAFQKLIKTWGEDPWSKKTNQRSILPCYPTDEEVRRSRS